MIHSHWYITLGFEPDRRAGTAASPGKTMNRSLPVLPLLNFQGCSAAARTVRPVAPLEPGGTGSHHDNQLRGDLLECLPYTTERTGFLAPASRSGLVDCRSD